MRTALLVATLWAAVASAQESAPKLSFEVASVKAVPFPSAGGSYQGWAGSSDPGRISYRNIRFKKLMQIAYRVPADQISGPAWIDTAQYNIDARLADGATREQFEAMLQNLLRDRFQLDFHRIQRDFAVYELAIAKGGPKLMKPGSKPQTPAKREPGDSSSQPVDTEGFPIVSPHNDAQQSVKGVALLAAKQVTLAAFAQILTLPLGFVDGQKGPFYPGRVVDKTGLEGEYDIRLRYSPSGPGPDDASDFAPNLFVALQRQLGLQLERTKQKFDVLVIDRAEKTPVEN